MDFSPMYTFLTQDNVSYHLEYYKTLQGKLSIYRKSLPDFDLSSYSLLMKSNVSNDIKAEILPLFNSEKLHKSFFESFTDEFVDCGEIKRWYSSVEALLFDMLCEAKKHELGFLCIMCDRSGAPTYRVVTNAIRYPLPERFLCIDLYEHAYFYDYGFSKETYLRAALSHLDFNKLFSSKS